MRQQWRAGVEKTVLANNRDMSLRGEEIPVYEVRGAVAMLDVLGLRAQTNPEFLKLLYYHTYGEKGYLERRDRGVITPVSADGKVRKARKGPLPPKTGAHTFQDSLVVYASGKPPYHRLVEHLMHRLYDPFRDALQDGVLFRGVVSVGTYYVVGDIIAGPAFYETISWHEKPDWAGVCLTPSAMYSFQQARHEGASLGTTFRYPVPLKGGGTLDTWALAWPRNFDRGDLVSIFSEMNIIPEVESKYRNTLAFYDAVRPHVMERVKEQEEEARKARLNSKGLDTPPNAP